MSSVGDPDSIPILPPDSPGSSVSTHFQEEYDELLRYAVVMPSFNPRTLTGSAEDRHTQPQTDPGETVITIASEDHQQEGRNNESGDTDTLVSQGSSDVQQRVSSSRRSPVMRDIFPELTDEEVYIRPETRSSMHNSSHVSTQQPKDKVNSSGMSRNGFRGVHTQPSPSDSMRSDSTSQEDVRHVLFTATIDPDVSRMKNLLDQWCQDLKRNVLAEYGQSKIQLIELTRIELQKEKERHLSDLNQVKNEMENLKELLHTYEQSVERKDQVISNLTNALQKNKEKFDMMKKFNEWKFQHNDSLREAYASNLAKVHHERKLTQKVWAAWHSVIETNWKQRVEKACQGKAQEVCVNLTNDYEARIREMSEALTAAQEEVSRLNKERDRYEEQMKKAFMRGVCALNLEAMTIFQGGEEDSENGAAQQTLQDDDHAEEQSCNFESSVPYKDYSAPKTIPKESVYRDVPQRSKPPTRMGGQTSHTTSARSTAPHTTHGSSRPTSKTKTFSTRITTQVETGKTRVGGSIDYPTLAPPVSTVMVERHQPVVKQTIGHAIANKYPKKDASATATRPTAHRKIAGQTGCNVQSVKVVD